MKTLRNAHRLLFALALAVTVGCQSDSPTEPGGSRPATSKPPEPVIGYSINITTTPAELTVGSTTPSNVTVEVRRTDTGQAPADLTPVTLTTSLGEFGSVGSGVQTLTLQLVNGRATAVLFPGENVGTATVRAQVDESAAATNVDVRQAETFFVSSISPNVGAPEGGQTVTIEGGGFDGPVRVTFNGATAQILDISPTRIRVRTPSATAAGVQVGVGQSVPVAVGVTVNLNETGMATDTLESAFVYSGGGGTTEPPRVFSVSPSSGTNDGGTRVTIVGSGFQAPVQVAFGIGNSVDNFNGVEATVESVTSDRIVAITPAARGFGQNLLNQLVAVRVINMNTGFATLMGQAFKYGTDVLITGLSTGAGPYTGGTRVKIFGQGFDDPVAVSLGGVGQEVLSVSGTEIEFRTTGTVVNQCPASGVITVTGVGVTNLETGDGATANIAFNYVVPRPQIFGISPTSGSPTNSATVSGQNFATNVQVLFGDPTSGSSAPVVSSTGTSISLRVPQAPAGFTFNTEPCDGNGDGIAGGTRLTPTAISVTVRNLDGTGCFVTLPNAFLLNPPNATCTGDTSSPPPPTPQCNDGIDNDGDGRVDFGAGVNNDPGCSSLEDNSEAG